jgi:hypothetical protein
MKKLIVPAVCAVLGAMAVAVAQVDSPNILGTVFIAEKTTNNRLRINQDGSINIALANPVPQQKMCDQFFTGILSGENPPIVRIPGVSGKRIYLCGYMVVHGGGPQATVEITSGNGDCLTEKTSIVPKLAIAGDLVNRTPFAAGEYTPLGHSLCTQTAGNGTVVVTLYWTQF